jgi:hypothetical protein
MAWNIYILPWNSAWTTGIVDNEAKVWYLKKYKRKAVRC